MIKCLLLLIALSLIGCGDDRSVSYHNTYNVTISRDAQDATVTGIVTKSTDTWSGKSMSSIATNIIANPVCRVKYGNKFKLTIKNDKTGEGVEMIGIVNRDLGDDNVMVTIIENDK